MVLEGHASGQSGPKEEKPSPNRTASAFRVDAAGPHPGFVPEPWGKIPRYVPTWVELTVCAGLWALGAFVFTVLAKAAIPIELHHLAARPGEAAD